jgi:SAM-dependent methyltransferase
VARHKTRKRNGRSAAATADRHVLYQLAVQDTDTEIKLIDPIFKTRRGRPPVSLREDFCGTALLCADWVKKRGRTATGVDIDPNVLAWGIEQNLRPQGEPGHRVRLLQQDVRHPVTGSFDVTLALNFSYFIFKKRDELSTYFENVRKSMSPDGLFFLDAYGGYEAVQPMEESRSIRRGCTYVWDQDKVDPINNAVINHIHFEFSDGSKLRKAFTYDWRLWSLLELRELLEETGFARSTVYWEDADDEGEGTGVFRPVHTAENDPAWVAYIVAER